MKKIASPEDFQSELQALYRAVGQKSGPKPSREKLASELRELADRVAGSDSKVAASHGPVGQFLDDNWNSIHDIVDEADRIVYNYDRAASYHGGAGQKAAQNVIKEVRTTIKALSDIGKVFERLHKAEEAFMRRHGHPDEYVKNMQDQIFPR